MNTQMKLTLLLITMVAILLSLVVPLHIILFPIAIGYMMFNVYKVYKDNKWK